MYITFPFFQFGKYGGARVVTQIANILSRNGNQVEFITIGNDEPYFPLDSAITITRVESKMQIIKRLHRKFHEYDAIIATYFLSTYPIFLASLLKFSFKKNYYYIQAYEPEFEFAKGKEWLRMFATLSYCLPFKRIVNSDLYKRYKNLKAEKVVYPGLDLELYYSKDVSFFNETIRVGCIGRKEEWKGTQDVCKAIELLKEKGYSIDFYIAFNDFKTVEHHFVKPDGDDKLSSFYRDMDIIVAPGHIQLGAVHYPVIESMAVGTSVITTGYLPADESNAYIVGVKKPKEIAEAIKEVLNNRESAIAKRKKAIKDVQQFSWMNIANKFMSILKEK